MADVLKPEEDETLRRLAALAEFGRLTPESSEIYEELRRRDRRREVRPPRVVAVPLPREPREAQPWVTV